ncbi:hypothetical protein COS38_01010 [Candidatus Berkelbacteria bacterium CG03_land_8_20_14_0_80_40_36]|uniref:Uncharacterized protein n=1 Tax=Candidatus Berkelbacteria bacterium CG03_land_8_20_14_0_80_40_36 TaxID=1974509 RepID=A0A2M7CIT5_9BACT|nr:MAG: hypothetical protein COS38_01010 [Candidatus Berkelbacteria bacterium CG03_land_8_20_14_0_80_40_36]
MAMLRMFIVDINFYDLHNLHKISFHPLSSSTESPFVILNRKRSASDWGSIPSRHPALDAGSIQSGFPLSRE